MIAPQVDEVKATTGADIKMVTADAGYAYAKVYGALERRGIDALIPAKAEPIRSREDDWMQDCDACVPSFTGSSAQRRSAHRRAGIKSPANVTKSLSASLW